MILADNITYYRNYTLTNNFKIYHRSLNLSQVCLWVALLTAVAKLLLNRPFLNEGLVYCCLPPTHVSPQTVALVLHLLLYLVQIVLYLRLPSLRNLPRALLFLLPNCLLNCLFFFNPPLFLQSFLLLPRFECPSLI